MKTEIIKKLKVGDNIYVTKPLTLRNVEYGIGDTFKVNCIIGDDIVQASRGNGIFNIPEQLLKDNFGLMPNIKGCPVKDKFSEVCEKLHSIYIAKNHDYGNSFNQSLNEFGVVAALVRMNDKFNRLKSLANKLAKVDESIDDTLLDLANYCIMTYMYRNEQYSSRS